MVRREPERVDVVPKWKQVGVSRWIPEVSQRGEHPMGACPFDVGIARDRTALDPFREKLADALRAAYGLSGRYHIQIVLRPAQDVDQCLVAVRRFV
jgi:hypothetical protein